MDDAAHVEADQLCMVAYLEGQRGNPNSPNLCKLQRQHVPSVSYTPARAARKQSCARLGLSGEYGSALCVQRVMPKGL